MSGKRRVYPQSEAISSTQPMGGQTPMAPTQYTQPTPMQPPSVPFFNPNQNGQPSGYPQNSYAQNPPTTTTAPPTAPPTMTTPQQPSTHDAYRGGRVYVDPEEQQSSHQPSSGATPDGYAQLSSGMSQMNVNQGYPPQQGYGQQYGQGSYGAQNTGTQPTMVPPPAPTPMISPEMKCPSIYMKMTTSHVPSTSALLNKCAIPLGAVLHPLAQPTDRSERIPVVNFAGTGIIRCRRCRSYINPFVTFTDGGRRWKCNLCALPNDVPPDYFSPTDSQGIRQDVNDRPELRRGVVEIVAPAEYMVRPPMPPVFFFVIDVSYYSITSGMFHTCIETIKRILNDFPGSSRTRIGFMTFDSTIHFYNLKSNLSQPQMMVVTDIDDVFVPLPSDLLVNLADSRKVVDSLLENFPKMFQTTQNVESALGVALKAAYEVIHHIGGKLIAFSSTLPSLGKGKLPNREDPKLLGTDRESSLLQPEDNFYKDFALDCSRQQMTVDLFLFPPSFIDVATIGAVSQFTGGQVNYYPNFRSDRDGEKFYRDLIQNITREVGFEAVLRVRTSKALKVLNHYGNFFIRSTDLLALPSIDSDKAFAVQLGLAESSISVPFVSIQSALLYTTSRGERRIRVFTECLPVSNLISDLFQGANIEAITTLTTKMAVEKTITSRLSDAREALVNKCIEILTVYKTDIATGGTSTSLLLPDSLKLLPLYILALIKNVAFRSGADVRPDERVNALMFLRTAPTSVTLPFLYPRLFALHSMSDEVGRVSEDGSVVLPPTLNLTSEKLERGGAFLLEDGQSMFLWVGSACPTSFVQDVFGVPSLETVDTSMLKVTLQENELSQRIQAIVEEVRNQRPTFMALHVIREGEGAREAKFFSYFVEDRTKAVHSYYEFLVNLHQRIQAKITKK